MNNKPKVKLVSWSKYPIGLMYAGAYMGWTDNCDPKIIDPRVIAGIRDNWLSGQFRCYMGDDHRITFENLRTSDINLYGMEVTQDITFEDEEAVRQYVKVVEDHVTGMFTDELPLTSAVKLNFCIFNVPIWWREQLVRHQVGSTYWVQGCRVIDHSQFHDTGGHLVPTRITNDPHMRVVYNEVMEKVQDAYAELMKLGAHQQDARSILGSGILHRLIWNVDLRALIHILNKRACFFAQALWQDIIQQCVREMVTKIDPLFQVLGYPPCKNPKNEFTRCGMELTMRERMAGDDPLPVCPLWTKYAPQDVCDEYHGGERLTRDRLYQLGCWDDFMVTQWNDNIWNWQEDRPADGIQRYRR